MTGYNTNLKETEKKVLNFSERYQILSNLFTILNYTYIDTKIIDDGNGGLYNGRDIPGVSPHTLKVSLGFNYLNLLHYLYLKPTNHALMLLMILMVRMEKWRAIL